MRIADVKTQELLQELGDRYGQTNVVVRSEYHVQILTPHKPHDIWFSIREGLKWRLAGQHNTSCGSPARLLEKLGTYDQKDSDFAKMQGAIALSNLIGDVSRISAREHITRAVFCDAGFKDGKSRIGLVRIDGEDVTAVRRNVTSFEIKNIQDAERLAITLGLAMANEIDGEMPVYSDNKVVVEDINMPRVKWIPRSENKHADRMANLRKETPRG